MRETGDPLQDETPPPTMFTVGFALVMAVTADICPEVNGAATVVVSVFEPKAVVKYRAHGLVT